MTGRGWTVATWRDWSQEHASAQRGTCSHSGPSDGMVLHPSTDTRTLIHPSASVFFAIRGPWHNGHDFLNAAHAKGVRRFVVSEPPKPGDPWQEGCDVLVVPDVLLALQRMARAKRTAFQGPVIAVTGSNGKTTVKEWLARLLPQHRAIHRSPLSHNSQLGVPLSMWSIEAHHDVSVIEAGISEPGEMQRLQACILPTVGVLTHLGQAHLGNFDGPAHLAEEKCALFKGCQQVFMPEALRDACAMHLDAAIVTWANDNDPQAHRADLQVHVDTSAQALSLHWRGASAITTVPFTDIASIQNACTAALVALHLDVKLADVAANMANLTTLSGRLSSTQRARGGVLIQDDCNHDFGSLRVALSALDAAPDAGRSLALVGDVPQSGLDASQRAQQLAELAKHHRLSDLWVWAPSWGAEAEMALLEAEQDKPSGAPIAIRVFRDMDELVTASNALGSANVLVKVASTDRLQPAMQALAPARHVTTLTLNTSALVNNLRALKAHAGAEGVIAVIKGLGYGTDPVLLGRLLEAQNVDWLAVAYADEGVVLREAGIRARILVLNPDPSTFGTMHAHDLEPQLVSTMHVQLAKEWAEANEVEGWAVHLKLDTGMHRLGLAPHEDEFVETLLQSPALELVSVMTHLAGADDPELDDATRKQLGAFLRRTTERFHNVPRHILNSAGAARIHEWLSASDREAHAPVLTHIRVGLAMYGVGPGAEHVGLENVLSLDTSVSKLVHIPAGEGSGYGFTDAVDHDRTLAVLSVGYADGYPRALGNGRGQVRWNGHLLPTVGRVCMDMVTVDATGLDVHPGDRVTLWGDRPRIDDVAAQASTIPYELLTRIGPRVQRIVQR